MPLQSCDIDIAHRLGTFDSTKKTTRAVIAKFTHRRKKHEILRARTVLKNSQYTVSEDLTKVNQDTLRRAYGLECVQNTFSTDGKLFAVLKVKNNNDKNKIRRIVPNTPLDEDYLLDDSNFIKKTRNIELRLIQYIGSDYFPGFNPPVADNYFSYHS